MARPLRIEFPGAIYHVTSRGNARQAIFLDDEDRRSFLLVLDRVVSRFRIVVHAFCLMDNHFHLLVETPEANLSKAIRQLNGVFTQAFNRRHGKVGHVLQGRFKAILVDRDSYLLELCRYVVLNPVRAKITRKPDTYAWSSYRATAGLDAAPSFLTVEWILTQFGRQRANAQRRYRAFVAEGTKMPSPWEELQGQILLGNEHFVDRLRPALRTQHSSKEIPRRQRHAGRPPLVKLFTAQVVSDRKLRDARIRAAHVDHGYSLSAIGGAVGLHYSTVSRIVTRQESSDAEGQAQAKSTKRRTK